MSALHRVRVRPYILRLHHRPLRNVAAVAAAWLSSNPLTSTISNLFTRNLHFSSHLRSKQSPVPGEPLRRLVKVIPGNFIDRSLEESNFMNSDLSFQRQLPTILENIRRSTFVAVDLEFSGLSRTPGKQLRSIQERYAEMRVTATTYQVLQLGICPVEWNDKHECYIAHPSNIYVNPIVPDSLNVNRSFTFAGDTVDFLLKNGFDFNVLFEKGVPYLSHEEEKSASIQPRYHNPSQELTLDDYNSGFVEELYREFNSWVEDKDSPFDFLNITTETGTLNNYQRRLVHTVISADFPSLRAAKKGDHIQVIKATPEQQEAEMMNRNRRLQDQIKAIIGVRHIIDELFTPKRADGRKTVLVGHNLMLDLLFIYKTFVGSLPHSAVEFASIIHKAFPTVVDTKYLATFTDRSGGRGSTLPSVWEMLKDQKHPRIMLHPDYMEYESAVANHEAGYDAFNCARILIKLAARMSSHYLGANTAWTSPNDGLTDFITAITQSSGNFRDDVYSIPGFHDEDSKEANKFWNTLSNKLRAFGTIEGLYELNPNP